MANMLRRNLGPRAEYRQRERQRVSESAPLAEKFPQLRSLTVILGFRGTDGRSQESHLRYAVNLANARSVFLVDCPNDECVGGDFDLIGEIRSAYVQQKITTEGEIACQGWRSKATIGSCRCGQVLWFRLDLGYDDPMVDKTQRG